jgi:putative aldouronate transport system permease protein
MYLYILVLPTLLYFVIFQYGPMQGLIIAFKEYIPGKGMWAGPWIGLKYFDIFFHSYYFWRILRNTILLSLLTILLSTPIPIAFAILLNEMRDNFWKRFTQTVSYFPHFISLVVVVGLLRAFVDPTDGVLNVMLKYFGREPINFLTTPEAFRPMYIISGIWQDFGWSSIIYLAALLNISPQLYEAASIEGATRMQRIRYITLPGILPTIVVLFILDMGGIMNIGFEKVYLLYNPSVYSTADVIATFTYRTGISPIGANTVQFSYAAAVGFFNSVVNFAVLVFVNWASKRATRESLW